MDDCKVAVVAYRAFLLHNLSGGIEEITKKLWLVYVSAGIRTQHLRNMSVERQR
jgi:hypothetical protein